MSRSESDQIEPGASATIPNGRTIRNEPWSIAMLPCHWRSAPPPQATRKVSAGSTAIALRSEQNASAATSTCNERPIHSANSLHRVFGLPCPTIVGPALD